MSPPRELVQQIIIDNYWSQESYARYEDCRNYSSYINAVADCDMKWDVIKSDKAFILIPHTNICTVDDSHVHSEHKHSHFVVTKGRVVAKCFGHSAIRTVTGDTSRRLCKLFFPEESNDSFENLMHSMFELCNESFARLDGYVWKVRSDKPWIYDRLASYEDFINMHFKGTAVFVKNPRKFADVIKYMEKVNNKKFPFIRKNADYVGFDNCVVNIVTYEVFDKWDDVTVPRHSICSAFDWNNIDTPMFDRLLHHQLGDGVVYWYFLAFIGRLFYRVNRFDNYNIVPLVMGDTGTGKSTILTIIKKMFAPGAVGVLNSNTFGLEAKYDKELLIAHEIGDKFTDRLSYDLFKQMVCGEDISIPRKNKGAINVTWSVPMFLCSNIRMTYSRCSINKRLAIFKFDKYVQQKDITLEARIIESELPAIFAKCLLAYKHMLEEIGSGSFWDVCPDYFHENTREMSEQTDYIYMFLTPGDNVYGDKDVYFMKQEGASMLLQDFKNKFINYMRLRHPGIKYRWTSDYSSFSKLGYSVEQQHICKGCGSHAESGCCDKYSMANRSKRYVIKDLVCIDYTL